VRLGTEATREELVRRLRYLAPAQDFRTVYQYQNLMYMTAGYLVEYITGSTWEELVQTRIFDRLGMTSSCLSTAVAQRSGDFALPYAKKRNRVVPIPFYDRGPHDPVGPAGAVVSTIADMSRWLLVHLSGGRLGEERLVSEAQIREMHTPQTPIPDTGKWPAELPHNAYGMGWHIEPYRGYDMIHHGGNIDGFSSMLSLMPGEGIGVMVLSNMGGTFLRDMLPYYVFDRLLGLPEIDWNARFQRDREEMEAGTREGRRQATAERVRRAKPSHRLEEYAGTYSNPGYGPITIRVENGSLHAVYNDVDLPLKHYHYDVFETSIGVYEYRMKIRFQSDVRGDIDTLLAPMEPTIADIVFTRVPDPALSDPTFLEQFVGDYELLGATATITLKNGALELSAPNLRGYELAPIRGTLFTLKNLSGVTIEFRRENGTVTEAIVNQFGLVLHAPRRALRAVRNSSTLS
jgi:hypothetical protein